MKKLKKITLAKEAIPLPETVETSPVKAEETVEESKTFFTPLRHLWDKAKPFPWKKINARNAIIAGCLVLIAVAGYLNIRYTQPQESVVTNPDSSTVVEAKEDFFASAILDRERARGEALEVLMSITEDEEAGEDAKEQAFHQMERIANETSWEIDIENLVKAKGFAECVAVINEQSANVVVESAGLTAGEVAQIKEIVYLEASIHPKDIKIIEKAPAGI